MTPRACSRGGRVFLPVAVVGVVMLSGPGPLGAQVCGTPGKDGPGGVLSGVVNTYYPGLTASLSAGATSISIGTATGAAVSITPGDLLLIVQMQDAAINSANASTYGANNGTGTGSTNINSSGRYEYVTATNAVGLGGGTVTVRGTGAGNGLLYSYTNAAASGTQGQRRYQVIRVPQYSSATLSSGLTAGYWNGTTGGILAIDVAGTLTLGGTVSVDGRGFRGGSGRGLTGGSGGTNTDYRNLATNNYHGMKGEGIAGTPRYVLNPATGLQVDNGVEGYPNGSSARGAPGTAGGGGTDGNPSANDQNSGGGGGANAGAGGRGGNTWSSNLAVGGLGGAAFAVAPARIALGGGGGAGSRNNSSGVASHGGAGGGIVFVRAGTVAGTGTISANGLPGNTPQNDGGGGGGAGGSVLVFAQSGGLTGLTVQARGGAGGNADVGGAPHGPGGGGGGGYVLLSSAAAVDVAGGAAGYTVAPGNLYGATAGAAGASSATLTAAQIPGASPSAACVPALSVTKTTSTPAVVNSPTGTTATYTIVVANAAGRDTARSVTVTDTLPAGFTYASGSAPVLSGGASRPSTTNPAPGAAVPTWGTFTIPGGGSVSLTFVVNIAATAPAGTYQNPARASYLDPGRTTVSGTTDAAYAPGSSTGEDVTVSGTTMGTVTGVVFDDANGDGIRQGGEPGLADVTVVITDAASGTQSVTTDGSGSYSAVVPSGATTVSATAPPGATLTTGNNPQTVTVPAGGTQAATPVGFGPAAPGCSVAPGGGPVFYEAFTEAWSATDVTSLNIPTTCGTSAGDLLVVVVSTNGDRSASLAPPAGQGWQLLNRQATGGFLQATQGVWWKIAGAGEPASHQFTWAGAEEAYGFMMRFTGHDPTTPIDASAFQTGADASPVSPSVTTTVDNTLILRVGTFHGASVTVDQPGLPGHVPITMDFSSNDFFGIGAVSAGAGYFSPQTPPGPTGTSAFSLTATQRWVAGTIAIRPGVTYGVSVTPDGTATLDRLPTNGTSYSFAFSVVNLSSVPQAFDLFAFPGDGGASFLSVDSITGATVSRGALPDSARLAALAVNDSAAATVWSSAALVPVGAQDSLYLKARSIANPTATDSGWVHVRIIRPDLSVAKGVTPNGTQPPGTDLTYAITLTNGGTADAVDVVNVDSLPPELQFKIGSVSDSLPTGVTVTVEYSNDGGATWTYTPVSLGCGAPAGYDACVTRIRWTLLSPLSAAAPNNVATLRFVARIK